MNHCVTHLRGRSDLFGPDRFFLLLPSFVLFLVDLSAKLF